MAIYYFDTCIWRDHFENRISLGNRPIGDYATKLFMKVIKDRDIILMSDFTILELKKYASEQEVINLLDVISLIVFLRGLNSQKKRI